MGVRVKVSQPKHLYMAPYTEHATNRWYVSVEREDDPTTMYVVRWAAKPTRKQLKLAAKVVATVEI